MRDGDHKPFYVGGSTGGMEYDAIATLPVTVEDVEYSLRERETSSEFTRTTTVVELRGDGAVGRGEDVTYESEDHYELVEADPTLGLPGEYEFDGLSTHLDRDLFPEGASGEAARHYRRWAFESAALDLALRQSRTDLGSLLGREYDPVRFVVSTRLGDPPTTDRVDSLLATYPEVEFKLDPTPEWTEQLMETLSATGRVCVLDLKGQYEDTMVDVPPDPDLYEMVIEQFPGAVVEDPALTESTRPVVERARDRVSWDVPITGVDSVESLPFEPEWLNVKPSRFGTVESLLSTLAYCDRRDISLYGGGQFELDVGRDQIQALAALFYPDGPNDVAPGGYNDPEVREGLATSPLDPPVGFGE